MGINENIELIITTQNEASENINKIVADIQKLEKQSKETSQKANASFTELKKVFAELLPALGAVAIVSSLKNMQSQFVAYADAVDTVSDATGVSAEQASKWVIQGKYVGTEAGAISNAMMLLGRNIVENEDAFTRYGVAVKDAKGNMLPLDDVISSVRDKTKQLGGSVQTTAMLMKLFGKGGKEMYDFMSLDNAEAKKLIDNATELGIVLSDTASNNVEQMNRNLNELGLMSISIGNKINTTIIPAIIKLGSVLNKSLSGWEKIIFALSDAWKTDEVTRYSDAITKLTDDLVKNGDKMTVAEKNTTLNKLEEYQRQLEALVNKNTKEFEIKQKNVNDSKVLTDQEIKDAYDAKLKSYALSVSLADKNRFDQLKILESMQNDISLKLKDREEAERQSALTIKAINDQSASDFISGINGGYDIVKKITEKFAGDIGSKLATTFTGLDQALSGIGLSVGGVFGAVAGTVVSGFMSLFGQQKTMADLVDEAFKRIADRTNKAIDSIGKEKTLAQKKLDILSVLGSTSDNFGNKTYKGAIASQLGVSGMGEIAAREKLLKELLVQQEKELELRKKTIPQMEDEIKTFEDKKKLYEYAMTTSSGTAYELNKELARQAQAEIEARQKSIKEYDKASEYDILKSILETRNLIGIPAFAEGGIVNKPTIGLIGESGAEAIIPLSKMNGQSITIAEGAFVINGVNFANEGQKKSVAMEIASYIFDYQNNTRPAYRRAL